MRNGFPRDKPTFTEHYDYDSDSDLDDEVDQEDDQEKDDNDLTHDVELSKVPELEYDVREQYISPH